MNNESATASFAGNDLARIQGEMLERTRPIGTFRLEWTVDTGILVLIYKSRTSEITTSQERYNSKTGQVLSPNAIISLVWVKMYEEFRKKGWLQ